MKRVFYIAIMVVVSLIGTLLPDLTFAQIDAASLARAQRRGENTSLGGVNPFATDEQGGEAGDSTKTRRLRKPLESYYFNDSIRALPNFMWTIDRDMNNANVMPIDTILTNWRIDYPYFLNGVGDMTLGGLGQSTLPFNYFDR